MAKKGVIRVATCQFAVGSNVGRNGAQIRRQITQAGRKRVDIVHFSECALSGYAGVEFKAWDGFDWELLKAETLSIRDLARQKKLWVVLGSVHRLGGKHLPHNCLYVIDPRGKMVERYDKRFCTTGDLKYSSPGDHCSIFEVNGVKCGLLICYDVRFPELYRAYRRLGAQCMFHSFYNARADGPGIHTVIMRSSLQCRAATNYMWISGNNSSGHYQTWPSVMVQPDGRIIAQLQRNRAGVMVNAVDTNREFYDASAPYRDRSMRGVLHSGTTVTDPRSKDRTCL